MRTDEDFLARLRTVTKNSVSDYRSDFPDAAPIPKTRTTEVGEETASTETVYERFNVLTTFYDDLFEVDSTSVRSTWQSNLVYDCSRRELLSLLSPNLLKSLPVTGRYSPDTGMIGVSTSPTSTARASSLLASELAHAYQDQFDSPTWDHPYLREGFEQAVAIKAQEHLAVQYSHDLLDHLAVRNRVQTLVEGYITHALRQGRVVPESLYELGLTSEEVSILRENMPWRLLRVLSPRYEWSDVKILPDYALFGSLLLVSETAGIDEPFSRAFHGTHPWEEQINSILEIEGGVHRIIPWGVPVS